MLSVEGCAVRTEGKAGMQLNILAPRPDRIMAAFSLRRLI